MLESSVINWFYMVSMGWWIKAGIKQKDRAIQFANKEAFSLGPVEQKAIPQWENARRGLLFGADLRKFRQEMRQSDRPLQDAREALKSILEWRAGGPLPSDVRKCRYARCSMFFLVRSRRNRVHCSRKCTLAFSATVAMRKRIQIARAHKLKRVKAALKQFRNLPDWKERAARKARVTQNFITYAIRRKEL